MSCNPLINPFAPSNTLQKQHTLSCANQPRDEYRSDVRTVKHCPMSRQYSSDVMTDELWSDAFVIMSVLMIVGQPNQVIMVVSRSGSVARQVKEVSPEPALNQTKIHK